MDRTHTRSDHIPGGTTDRTEQYSSPNDVISAAPTIITNTPVTLAAQHMNKGVISNLGATGPVQRNLPKAIPGYSVSFTVDSAQSVIVNPDDADQIDALTDAVGDSITIDGVVGNFVTLLCVQSLHWRVMGNVGSITDTN